MDMMFHDLVITDGDFERLVQFIHKNYGIDLSKKRQLITSRLSHSLKEKGYSDFKSFLEHLFTSRDPQDLELVLNKLTTNYTYFLREKDHFTFFQNTSVTTITSAYSGTAMKCAPVAHPRLLTTVPMSVVPTSMPRFCMKARIAEPAGRASSGHPFARMVKSMAGPPPSAMPMQTTMNAYTARLVVSNAIQE